MKPTKWILLLALFASSTIAAESYCFNAGIENGWDCVRSEDPDSLVGREYYTLKVRLSKGDEGKNLKQILPIEKIAEVSLLSGEKVVFLGRFRDSMKAFRVVEKCRDAHDSACANYSPKVVRIGVTAEPDEAEQQRTQLASLDLKTKAPGDLVKINTAMIDVSSESVSGAVERVVGNKIPRGLIDLPASLNHVFWVDLNEGNLHVLERDGGQYKLAETMSVSIGKSGYGKMVRGDKKTPVGVYRLTSYLADENLDDFYGVGAFTLNYPNAVDKIHERTGSGIWLHGLPKGKDHRPLMDSDGCVVLSNSMIQGLRKYVSVQDTPIVLDNDVEWVDPASNMDERESLRRAVESWRSAWSSKDNDRYLSFYADDFTTLEKDIDAWRAYKTRIHKRKRYIKVSLSDLSILGYPNEPDTFMVRFYQRYESDNFKARGWKEQLWRKGGNGWRITYERG